MTPAPERTAQVAALSEAFDALCLLVDEQATGLVSGVLVLDPSGKRWEVIASPGLPESWRRFAQSVELTPTSGASGVAVHERRQIIVTDIATSALYGEIARQASQAVGIRACWAHPFFSREGRVLGVVTVYCLEARVPNEHEQRVVTHMAQLAFMATEGMVAAAARDASETRFRLASEVLAGFLFDWDPVTNRLEWFGGMEEVLGFRLDEVAPDIAWYHARVHPDDRPHVMEASLVAIDSGASEYSNMYRCLHRDGHYVDLLARGRVIRDEAGRAVRVLGGVTDISELRRLERAREDLLEREHRARVAAETVARQRDHVLDVVARELGSPLGAIGTCAHVLGLTDTPSAERAAAVDLIERCVAWMHRMIRDLSDIASIETSRLSLSIRSEDPVALLTAAAEMLAATASQAGVELETSVAPDLPLVQADSGRVLQVLGNLVGNAVRYTPRGGRVRLHAQRDPAGVRFTVEDTGVGIDADELQHVFDRFWHSRRVPQRGSGLGLPIVRGIVEAHGGSVDVTSTIGEGTRFGFTIPSILESE
jgi:PAS domain S-box-containing protein